MVNEEKGKLQLFYVPESPFATKLLFAIHELGLINSITLQPVSDPPNPELVEVHDLYPLSAFVPSLVTPDSGTLYDSSVILQYLDNLAARRDWDAEGERLFPPAGTPELWAALTYEALCKGVMGTVMMVHQQRSRGAPEKALAPQEERVRRGFARLARGALPDAERKTLDVKGIALGSMLGYMVRCEWCEGWREWDGASRLADWFELVKHRLPEERR